MLSTQIAIIIKHNIVGAPLRERKRVKECDTHREREKERMNERTNKRRGENDEANKKYLARAHGTYCMLGRYLDLIHRKYR